jgi:hypothetical protein
MLFNFAFARSSWRPIIVNGLIDLRGKGRHPNHAHAYARRLTYLVKRSGVIEATLPNLIHRTRRCRFIGTAGVRSNRQYRPPTDTCLCTRRGSRGSKGSVKDGYSGHRRRYLVLFGERRVSPAEFAHVSAVPTQTVCADLCSAQSCQRRTRGR